MSVSRAGRVPWVVPLTNSEGGGGSRAGAGPGMYTLDFLLHCTYAPWVEVPMTHRLGWCVSFVFTAVLTAMAAPAGAQDCPAHLLDWRTLPAGYVGEQECTFLANCNLPPLQPGSGYHCCNDGLDNDGDGLMDGNDPDCQHEYLCQDGLDNDGDGLADGADADCQCLGDVTNFTGCTANDTKIVLIGLGNQDDGCLNSGDTQTIWLRSEITTTATTRYDLGMWIHLDGLTTLTGLCSRRSLKPVAAEGAAYQPATGYGLFDNEDGDACGETKARDGITVYQYTFPITTPCVPTTDGFLSMGRCGSWDNNASTTCNGFWQALPGTTSKCRCEESATNIPAPALSLACATDRTEARPGWQVQYTITYTNSCACTPDTRPEHVRCCTAAYVRFPFSYSQGTIANVAIDGTPVSLPDAQGRVVDAFDSGTRVGTLTWTPQSSLGTLGVVGAGRTQTLTFTFTVDPTAPAGSLANAVGSEWSKDGTFVPAVAQSLAASCPITVNPTYATVSDVALAVEGGVPTLRWEASAEVGVVGYNVYRLDEATSEFTRVNQYLLPALAASAGGSYRLADPAAPLDRPVTYRIGEREFRGGETMHGPFTVTASWQAPAAAPSLDDNGFGVVRRAASPRPAVAMGEVQRGEETVAAGERRAAPPPARVGAKIQVAAPGLYEVTADDVATALGVPRAKATAAIKTGQLALATGGQPVAWQGASDGSRLWFFATAIDTPYTRENVYVLTPGRGELMAATTVAPAPPAAGGAFLETVRVEEDRLPRVYIGFAANEDFWYWDFVMSENPAYAQKSFPFTLDAVASGAGPATFTLFVSAASEIRASPDGRALVAVNGHPVGETFWDGLAMHSASFTVPASYLREGANTLTVTGTAGTLLVEAFEITYPRTFRARGDALLLRADGNATVTIGGFTSTELRLYDVTDPQRPRSVSGFASGVAADGSVEVSFWPASPSTRYLAVARPAIAAPRAVRPDFASDLANKETRASYLVIAPEPLLDGARTLARYRESRGLATMVVSLEDVYDEFSYGIPDPEAVRRFVRKAATSWRTPPRFLALVGKGSFDYRDTLGLAGNFLPPILTPTTYGLFAADSLFGDLDDDGVAEVAVGRIPAVSVAEVERYVAKLAAYEGETLGPWTSRLVMLADNPDYAGNFPADSDTLLAEVPAGVQVTRIHLGAPYTTPEARARTLQAMADGALLLTYVGHAGADRLAAEGLLVASDAATLANAPRLPVVAGLTCYVDLFAHPGLTSIGEALLLAPAGGAVAVWAPTGLAVNATSVQLGARFVPAFYSRTPALGEKISAALAAFAAAGGDGEHLRIYTLLGDPAVAVTGFGR